MKNPENVVFFDGVCNFCNATVNWLMIANKRRNLMFASLQGKTAEQVLAVSDRVGLASLVYYRKGKVYRKSTAALWVFRDTAWYGFLAFPFFLIPIVLRNRVYDWVASNRYRWFGKRDSCRVPTLDEKARFLD
jgi:predicted DCC family thiol-disulfide oxidoreductase YuxK